ncbi:MAG: flagellar hook capping FlgD N-terminal domain-containing protein [Giesbergeria sp.]
MISSTSSTTSVLDTGSTTDHQNKRCGPTPRAAQDRFLKLLVAQLNNQDPMNPMDNAQMTSQIAQINTVTGIQQLNETVKGLAGQFAAQQLMQGSAMVGRNVLVRRQHPARSTPKPRAVAAPLTWRALQPACQVQVLDVNNKQVGTVELGALKAGRYNFDWQAGDYEATGPLHFKVMAANGDAPVDAVPLAVDQVTAVSMDNGALALQLSRGGTTSYSAIKAIL